MTVLPLSSCVGWLTVDSTDRIMEDTLFEDREGFYTAQYEAISEIEDLFGEVGGVQFQTSIQDLWQSMQELAKSPDSLVVRSTVINAASDFLTRAKDIYSQLCSYQQDLNIKIMDSVAEINDLGNKIYDLNLK